MSRHIEDTVSCHIEDTMSCRIEARVWRAGVEEPAVQKLGEGSLGRLSWVGGQP